MLTSLFTGTSGLKANMLSMSVIGNNLANMNTIGFKGSRTSFADILGQSIGGSQGTSHIGLGVKLSNVSPLFSQGSLESTTSATDLAIEGDGLFITRDASGATYYTRAGQFNFDKDGFMVNPDGYVLRGYAADSGGNLGSTIEDLQLSFAPVPPNSTSTFDIVANIDSDSGVTGFIFEAGVNDEVTFTIDPGGGGESFEVASLITAAGLVDGQAYTGLQAANAVRSAMESVAPGYKFSVDFDPLNGLFTLTNDAGNATDVDFTWSGASSATVLGFNAADSGSVIAGATDTSDMASGAFDVSEPVATSNFSTAVTVYDSLGNSHQVAVYFRKDTVSASGNSWEWFAVVDAEDSDSGLTEVQASGTMDFTTSGALNSESAINYALPSGGFDFAGGSTLGQAISFDFGDTITEGSDGLSGITQYGQESAVYDQSQDGYAFGNLQRNYIDANGTIIGVYSNGKTRTLGRVALADFNNPAALAKSGGNMYVETVSSGEPLINAAGTPGFGTIHSSALELSTVDIAEEFVRMITAQRGFQANSRVISTTDDMLAELVNLKR